MQSHIVMDDAIDVMANLHTVIAVQCAYTLA